MHPLGLPTVKGISRPNPGPANSPPSPDKMDWSTHFPTFFQPPPAQGEGSVNLKGKKVEFADVGCGFGGLSIALAPLFPETLMLGMFHHTIPPWRLRGLEP